MWQITDYLAAVGEGRLKGSQVDRLLASCWEQLDGAYEGGMQGIKLLGRMEAVRWQAPILSFRIERHGGTVNGSTRGELQHWEIDLDHKTARIVRCGQRQLKPMAKRMSIQAIADEVICLVLAGTDDPRIRKCEDRTIQLVASVAFPTGSGFKRTVEGRRKRLVECVAAGLKPHGWTKATGNKFLRDTACSCREE